MTPHVERNLEASQMWFHKSAMHACQQGRDRKKNERQKIMEIHDPTNIITATAKMKSLKG